MNTSQWFPNAEAITVSEKNKYYKSIDGIMYTKDGKVLICCPPAKTGEVHIPEGVETINIEAFAENKGVTKIFMPDSLKTILNGAFKYMENLEYVDFGHGIKAIGSLNSDSDFDALFAHCPKLNFVDIPEQVNTIGSRTFVYCESLDTLTLYEGLKYIGKRAFSDTAIKSVSLPSTVTDIGDAAFISTEKITIDR